jgi:hypothetical protein
VRLTIVANEHDPHLIDLKQRAAAIENLLEHRLSIGHRAADHAQQFGGCGLVCTRFIAFGTGRGKCHLCGGKLRCERGIGFGAWYAHAESPVACINREFTGQPKPPPPPNKDIDTSLKPATAGTFMVPAGAIPLWGS